MLRTAHSRFASIPSLLALLMLTPVLLMSCAEPPGGDDDDAADDDDSSSDDDDSSSDDDDSSSGDDDDDSSGDDDDSSSDDDDDDSSGDDDDTSTGGPSTTLVTIDDSTHELVVVDEVTGAGTAEVTLQTTVSMCSTIFTRVGSLYTSGGGSLWEIDPCTGSTTEIAQYSPLGLSGHPPTLCGLATRNLNDLYGIDLESNNLVQVDPATAVVTVVGNTGVNFGTVGLTWDQPNDRFLAINGADDNLYAVDVSTGVASLLVNLNYDIGAVGVELDPISGVLYACTGPNLLAINPVTGAVHVRGTIWTDPTCDDLGATWVPVPCLED